MAYLAIFFLYKAYLLSLLFLRASKCIRLRHLKLCIFFLNILVCCKQQGVKRWRQNGQGGFPVKKNRAECFPLWQPLWTQWLKFLIVTKWIKSCLLQCFGTFKMPILMFISILVFRPEGQIWNPVRRDTRIYVRRILNASRISKTQLNSCTISPS